MKLAFPSIKYYESDDDRRLVSRVWQHADPIADVVYLHGIISHGGWYLPSCSHLAKAGFQVHFLERRGSGLNAENRGDVDRYQTWLADVVCYLDRLPKDRPRILLGISWGGILAATIARQYPDRINGLGLICPGLFSFKAANWLQRTAIRLAYSVGLSDLRVDVPLRDPALFTNSPVARQYVAEDPFALRRITIRFALENLKLLREATCDPTDIRVPVLLLMADGDPIVDGERTRDFVGRIGHPDQRIIQYSGASHTLEFEDDPSQYFHDLSAWCSEVASGDRGSVSPTVTHRAR